MVKQVIYEGKSLVVSVPKEDLVIYTHPRDSIKFDFDLLSLKKEIVKGDLVIHFLNGKKITIANYALMAGTDEQPSIVDALSRPYVLADMLGDTKAVLSSNHINPQVINRKLSSADIDIDSGAYLAAAVKSEKAEQDKLKFTGDVEVDEHSTVSSSDTFTRPYKISSFGLEGIKKDDIDETFTYTGKTYRSKDRDDVLPTPVIFTRLNIDALYGARITRDVQADGLHIDVINGGGTKAGTMGFSDINGLPAVEYQYLREKIDLSGQEQKIIFHGSNSTKITRQVQIEARGSNVSITELTLSGVPDGVTIKPTSEYTVRAAGKGKYVIEARSQTPKLDIVLEYDRSFPPNSYKIDIAVDAYNYKYESLVKSEETMYWDFKPVNSYGDISNFDGVNVFTFSTNIDKLEITTSKAFDDIVYAGLGDHIYNTLEGNNTFYSGLGNDTVKMGSGNNLFIIGRGNNAVVAGGGFNELDIEGSDYISKLAGSEYEIKGYVNVIIGSGKVQVNYNDKNNNAHKTEAEGFRYIFLGDNVQVVTIDNTNNIGDTYLIANRVGSFSLKAGDNGKYDLYINNTVQIYADESYVTTNGGAGKAYFNVDRNGSYVKVFDTIYGSLRGGDFIYASDTNIISYVGRSSAKNNTVSYEKTNVDHIFNEDGTGKVSGNTISSYNNINKIIGGQGNDTFYAGFGQASSSMEYWGYTAEINSGNNTVTYEKSVSGVTINYITSNKYVAVTRGTATDKLYHIQNIVASNKDDTFIMDTATSRNIDGKGGINTVDYSQNRDAPALTININKISSFGFEGVATKSLGIEDKFDNISKFIGINNNMGTTFNINISAYKGGGTYQGSKSNSIDKLDYSGVKENSLYLNISSGAIEIRDKTNITKIGEDKASNISNYVLTQNNDTVIIENLADFNKIAKIDASGSDFEIGNKESKGNVLIFDSSKGLTNTDDFFNSAAGKLLHFDSLVLSSKEVNYFKYNTNISQMFTHIYASNKGDSFDMSSYTFSLDMDIEQLDKNLSNVKMITNEATIYAYDFVNFIGSSLSNTFRISATDKGSFSYSGGANNTLNYSGITGKETSVNLFIDLRYGEVYKGKNKDDAGSVKDTFSNVSTITGGKGNDTFYLDPSKAYTLDGGDGTNTISFKYYTTAIGQDLINQYSKKNFQIFELTESNNDVVSRDYEDTNSLTIKGNNGINSYIITNSSGVVGFDVKADGIVVSRAGSSTDTIYQFERITGGTNGNTYNISASSNDKLSNSGSLYFSSPTTSTNNSVEYSLGNTVTTITIGDVDNTGLGSYISIFKGTSGTKKSVDYFDNINKITFNGNAEHQILFGNMATNWTNTEINAGGNASISFANSYNSNTIIVDGGKLDVNSTVYNISGWNKIVGGFADDIFILKNITTNYELIDGGSALNTLDISGANTGNMKMVLDSKDKQQKMTFADGKYINYKNFNSFVFDASKKIELVGYLEATSDTSQGYNFSTNGTHANNSSSLDYSKVTFANDRGDNGFIFNISEKNTAEIIKDAINRKIDTVTSDFIDIYKGTSKDDTFIIKQGKRAIEIDGNGGRNSLQFNLSEGTAGLTYDLNGESAYIKDGSETLLTFENIAVITGSSGDDTFLLGKAAENIFANKGNIAAGGGTVNKLDLTEYTKSLTLNVGNLQLSEVSNTSNYIYFSGMTDIKLSNQGGNVLIMADVSNTTIKSIDGGSEEKAANMYSFENQSKAMNVTLGEFGSAGSTISITNFSSYKLTNFNDTVKVTTNSIAVSPQNGYTVDGGGGTNTIDYSESGIGAFTLTIENEKGDSKLVRGDKTDTLKSFTIYNLAKADATVKVNSISGSYTITSQSGYKNIADYSGITDNGSFTFDFGLNGKQSSVISITKVSESGFGIDSLTSFNNIVTANVANTFILNDSYMNSSGNSEVNITLQGDKATGSFNAVSAKKSMEYSESSANLRLGTSNYVTYSFNDASKVTEVYGSATQKNTFEALGKTTTSFFGGSSGKDKLTFENSDLNLTFDFLAKTVVAAGSASSNYFNNINEFVGGKGNNTFMNLTDYISYTIDGGNSDKTNKVSYDQAFFALTFTLDSSGQVVVDKKGGTVKDNLRNINYYQGSSLNDTFVIDLNVENIDKYTFDGGLGNNKLILKNAPSTLNIVYNESGSSTIGDKSLNIKNIQSFDLSQNGGNTFTVAGTTFPTSLNLVAGGSNNKFILNTEVAATKNLVGNIDLSKGTAILQTFSSRIDLASFDDITVKAEYNATFNVFGVDNSKTFNLHGVTTVGLYDFAATAITFTDKVVQMGNTKLDGASKYAINLYSMRTGSSTLDLNVNSVLNSTFYTNLAINANINISQNAIGSIGTISVNSVSGGNSGLAVGGSGYLSMKSFGTSALNLSNSNSLTLKFGSGSYDIFKTVTAKGTGAVKVDFSSYTGTVTNININNSVTTLVVNNATSTFNKIYDYVFNNLEKTITISSIDKNVSIDGGDNTTVKYTIGFSGGSATTSGFTFNANDGNLTNGSNTINFKNISIFDFSSLTGNAINNGVTFKLGGTANPDVSGVTAVAQKQAKELPHNILDLSNTSGANIFINFAGISANNSLMNITGSYVNGSTNVVISSMNNFKQIIASNQLTTIKFGIINYGDFLNLIKLVNPNPTGNAGFNANAMLKIDGKANTTVDMSNWNLTRSNVWNWDTIKTTDQGWGSSDDKLLGSILLSGGGSKDGWYFSGKGNDGSGLSYSSATPVMMVSYSTGNLVLPQGIIYYEQTDSVAFNLRVSVNNKANSYLIFGAPGNGGYKTNFDLFQGSEGKSTFTTTSGNDQVIYGVEAIAFNNKATTINIGSSGADGVFLSSKVKLALNTIFSPNSNASSGGNTADVSFSNIDSGNYYFTYETFGNPRHHINALAEYKTDTMDNTRQADAAYITQYKDWGIGKSSRDSMLAGVGFTTYAEKDRIESGQREGNMDLMYGMEGIKTLTLTSATNTFSAGKFYNSSNGKFVSPFLLSYANNKNNQLFNGNKTNPNLDGGTGYSTYLDQAVNANLKGSTGTSVHMFVKWTMKAGSSSNNLLYVDNAEIRRGGVLTAENNSMNASQAYTKISMKNFNALIIDDYTYKSGGYNTVNVGNSSSGTSLAYRGKQDTIDIIHNSSYSSTFTANLGGRYILDGVTTAYTLSNVLVNTDTNGKNGSSNAALTGGNYASNVVSFDAQNTVVNLSWVSDYSNFVDTSMYIRAGDSNYVIKNFDQLHIKNASNVTLDLRSNINFDALSGKMIRVDGLSGTIGLYSGYNYKVSTYGPNSWVRLEEVVNGRPTGRKFEIWGEVGSKPELKQAPSSVSDSSRILYDYNVEQDKEWVYGNSESEDKETTEIPTGNDEDGKTARSLPINDDDDDLKQNDNNDQNVNNDQNINNKSLRLMQLDPDTNIANDNVNNDNDNDNDNVNKDGSDEVVDKETINSNVDITKLTYNDNQVTDFEYTGNSNNSDEDNQKLDPEDNSNKDDDKNAKDDQNAEGNNTEDQNVDGENTDGNDDKNAKDDQNAEGNNTEDQNVDDDQNVDNHSQDESSNDVVNNIFAGINLEEQNSVNLDNMGIDLSSPMDYTFDNNDNGFENSMEIIDEGSIIHTQRLSETDSMSFALDDNNMINDNNTDHHTTGDVNNKKHNNM